MDKDRQVVDKDRELIKANKMIDEMDYQLNVGRERSSIAR